MEPAIAHAAGPGLRRVSLLSLFVAIAALLLAAPAGAEVHDLLVNGEFVADNSGWTITDSSAGQNIVFWTTPAGTPPSPGGVGGSLNLTAFRNSSITASQCITSAGNVIGAGVLVFPFVEAGPSITQLVAFGSSDCSGDALGTIPMAPLAVSMSAWITHQVEGARVPAGTRSIRFELGTSDGDNNSDGDYLFDGARLEFLNVFADGFEDASAP